MNLPTDPARRRFLRAGLLASAGLLLAACARQIAGRATPSPLAGSSVAQASPPTTTQPSAAPATPESVTAQPTPESATVHAAASMLPPTPACGDDDDDPTPAQTEGPYYTPNTPERASLIEAGVSGTRLIVSGTVLSTSCQPIARALLDFWQCDDGGVYDNAGFRLRGHQFADDQGRYTLETIVPGVYPGRTRHIHVKVQAPNQPVLTTQLYFPDEPGNARDGIFDPALVMDLQDGDDAKRGSFDFVLTVA